MGQTVAVTVTEGLLLRLVWESRRPRAHHRLNPYPGAGNQNQAELQKCFQLTKNRVRRVDRSDFISVISLFHARSAATEKALQSWKLGHGALTEDFRVKFSSELVTSALGNAKPSGIVQTRVYGFDGLQTRVPGYPGL